MKATDYSKIADKYDKNKYRHKIGQDPILKGYIEDSKCLEHNVLDLACGTGIYLSKQMEYFKNYNINWYGLDLSEDMLEKARKKVPNASFVKGFAEDLPYEHNKFNYIVNNYAFHHFKGKVEALDEITRVIKQNGIFKMHNIAIHQMKNWWVYKYFPSAYYEDLTRFWDKDLIFHELSIRGFHVEINIKYRMQNMKVSDLLEYVENRDISILTLIDEKEYLRGLEMMKHEISNEPDIRIVCDFADLFCVARKL